METNTIKTDHSGSGKDFDQSIGMRRVRAKFNPSGQTEVDDIKYKTAHLINIADNARDASTSFDTDEAQRRAQERNRCIAIAQTKYEEAAMFLVKALTS